MRVDIEYIYWLQERRKEINGLCLRDIQFYKEGKQLRIKKKVVRDFEVVGLNNIDFITSEFYQKGWTNFNEI